MSRRAVSLMFGLWTVLAPLAAKAASSLTPEVRGFLKEHCIRCHGPEKQKGDVRLDTLSGSMDEEVEVWTSVRDQLRDGQMPPKKEKKPDAGQVLRIVATLTAALPKAQFASDQLPNKGNLIPHELLFGKPAPVVTPSPGRLWRLNSDSYLGLMNSVYRGKVPGLVKPFTLIPERGLKDYAALYSMDEPTTEILMRNAAVIVDLQTAHEFKEGKVAGKGDSIREYVVLMDPAKSPTPEEIGSVATKQFQLAIGRSPTAEEIARYQALYAKCAANGDRAGAVKTVLQVVLLRADAVFRSEMGDSPAADGRRKLAPVELATALSLALGHRRLEPFVTAAAKGQLGTREQIATIVGRVLDEADGRLPKPRLLEFFQQYFGYTLIREIFKEPKFPFPEYATEWATKRNRPKGDETKRGSVHAPEALIADTDRLVLGILAEDKDVLRQLLTTDMMFVNLTMKMDKQTRLLSDPVPATSLNAINDRGMVGPHYVYGLDEWPADQPVKAPPDKPRVGLLMQPSWLTSHSTNFDNDPVRRGRWIRERLLGQVVPDLPIGVEAQVPDEKHHTFRTRLQVTREEKCWKCHQWMDDLGLPFEQFDHYGLFRKAELVVDREATARNVDAKGKPQGDVFAPVSLNTSGVMALTDDPALDGPVTDPFELVRRLADSTRVRQVFIRHVFRYFLGRNETLDDARTLQEADQAYVASRGSFKAVVTSLLTSDSFLYRSTASPAHDRSTVSIPRP